MSVLVMPTETVIIAATGVMTRPVTSVQVTNLDATQTVNCSLYAALGSEQLAALPLVELNSIAPLGAAVAQVNTTNLSRLELRGTTDGAGALVQAVMV